LSQLGEKIKKRRLALGQSRGQLASSLGTTATVVASLERGERVPDGETVALLAKAFGVEPQELTGDGPSSPPDRGAGDEVPVAATALTVTAPAAGDAVDGKVPAARPSSSPLPPIPASTTNVFDEMDRIPVVAATAATRPAKRSTVMTGPPPAELIDAPTEAVPVVEPAPVMVVAAPAPAAVEPTTGLYGSYRRFLAVIFDRDRPYLSWIRAALTVIFLLIGLRVLAWAVPAFFDALGDILSTIESTNPTATTVPGA
jgi:transcriptional regulator with XRE-family HTH domain